MKRKPLLSLLKSYYPTDEEKVFLERFIHFVETNPDCFERSLEVGHVTASAWLLNKERTHVLLMHHAKLHLWVQLGGHCDGDPDVLGVAIKEAQEESGLTQIRAVSSSIFDIDIHVIPAREEVKEHLHYDVRFLLQAYGDEAIVQNRESNELRWVSSKLGLEGLDPSVLRLFRKGKPFLKKKKN